MYIKTRKFIEDKSIFNVICYLYFIYTLPFVFNLIENIYNYLISTKSLARFYYSNKKFIYIIQNNYNYYIHECPYLDVYREGLQSITLYKGYIPICKHEEQKY